MKKQMRDIHHPTPAFILYPEISDRLLFCFYNQTGFLTKDDSVCDDICIAFLIQNFQILPIFYLPACLFCGESLEVVDFRGKRVCRGCIRKLQKSLKVNKRRPVRGRR